MKRLIAKAALVIVAAAGVVGVAGSPAMAAGRPCITGTVCIYDVHFIGYDRYVIVDNYSSGFCFNFPPEWDNRIDTAKNLTNHEVSFFGGNYCQRDGLLRPAILYPGEEKNVTPSEANSLLFR